MDPMTAIYAASALGGTLGSIFGSGQKLHPETERALKMLRERYEKGIDPKVLELMRRRLRTTLGNEYAGMGASTAARLRRQNVPVSRQQEILDQLNVRRFGALGEGMAGIDIANEQMRLQALQQLAGMTSNLPITDTGQGFGALGGMGFAGLMRMMEGNRGMDYAGNLEKHYQQARRFRNYQIPSAIPYGG